MNELYEFQLLRPIWLLGLLPVAWLLWKAWHVKSQQGAWHQVIAPQFRHLLLGDRQTGEVSLISKLSLFGLGFIWLLTVAILTGPSIKSVEMPAEKNHQGSVILLDLSLSMLADDLAPDRISRAKYKIIDLLKRHPELSIGMVAYADSAHAISPISEDNQTLLSMLPALNPIIMPSYGSNPLKGFEQAKRLFEGAHISKGHIIWITDDLEINQKTQIQNWIMAHDYSVSILTVGTEQGGVVQIPDFGLLKGESGNIILPSVPMNRFNSLAHLDNVSLNNLSISNDLVDDLLPPLLISESINGQDKKSDNSGIYPLDEGAYLLFLLLPLVALLYRRGWILSLSLLSLPLAGLMASALMIGLLSPTQSYAEEALPDFTDAFRSPDQQAYKAFKNNQLESAESLFEDPQWRASSLYRLAKYKEAAELFSQDKSPAGDYNLGNALAKSGQLKEAKAAYESALQKQPNMPSAQKNLDIISKLLKQEEQKQDEKKSNQDKSEGDENKNSDEKSEPQSADQSDDESDEKSNDSESSKSKSKSESESDEKQSSEQAEPSDQQSNSDSASKKGDSGLKDEPVESSEKDQQTEADQSSSEDQESSNEQQEKEAHQSPTNEKNDTEDSDSKAGKLADKTTSTNTNNQEASITQKQQEQQQATQNWLKQIPDEPGLFLKRKFQYQYQQEPNQSAQDDANKKQW